MHLLLHVCAFEIQNVLKYACAGFESKDCAAGLFAPSQICCASKCHSQRWHLAGMSSATGLSSRHVKARRRRVLQWEGIGEAAVYYSDNHNHGILPLILSLIKNGKPHADSLTDTESRINFMLIGW